MICTVSGAALRGRWDWDVKCLMTSLQRIWATKWWLPDWNDKENKLYACKDYDLGVITRQLVLLHIWFVFVCFIYLFFFFCPFEYPTLWQTKRNLHKINLVNGRSKKCMLFFTLFLESSKRKQGITGKNQFIKMDKMNSRRV